MVLSQVRRVCGYSALTIEHEPIGKITTSFEHSVTEGLLSLSSADSSSRLHQTEVGLVKV